MPVAARCVQAQLTNGSIKGAQPASGNGASSSSSGGSDLTDKHHAVLLSLLAEQLGCAPSDIVDFELNICDVQPGVVGGAQDEFIYVGRLDNLASCYVALEVSHDSCTIAGFWSSESLCQVLDGKQRHQPNYG